MEQELLALMCVAGAASYLVCGWVRRTFLRPSVEGPGCASGCGKCGSAPTMPPASLPRRSLPVIRPTSQ
ncbi:MAG: hypothetical protein HY774_09260 [Acidobacteria bacterium]|nr:hypothetical protein [Acidobacteriota bacterium]